MKRYLLDDFSRWFSNIQEVADWVGEILLLSILYILYWVYEFYWLMKEQLIYRILPRKREEDEN